MTLPSPAEIDHADWPSLQRMCAALGLNPKGRSAVVRLRVMDHVRRRRRPGPWRAAAAHVAPLLTRLGFPEAAGALWEDTIRLDAPSPWVGLGAAHLAAGELAEASKAFERAAQMGDAVAHLHRAEAHAAGGDLPAAVRACDAFLARRPGDLRGMVLKASFLARGGWIDESAATMRAAFESHPDAAELWRGIGSLLIRAGRWEPAAEALREAVRRDPGDLDALVNRGTALLRLGKTREAVGAYREALESDPARAEALNNLGVAYLRVGQEKSAAVNLERAAKHLESPEVLRNLARIHERTRQKSEALETYERLLKIAPRDAAAAAARKRLGPPRPAASAPRTRRRPARKGARRSRKIPARQGRRKPSRTRRDRGKSKKTRSSRS